MNYIIDRETGGINLTPYTAYLTSIRQRLPDHIYSFASNPRHFDLDSPESLHDAWLENLTIQETATGERREIRRLKINLCLLGPFHDRQIHLRYTDVARYSFEAPQRGEIPRLKHGAHGDLFTHEIRLSPSGLFVHELLFEKGTTFLIECADIRHSETMISADA